MEKTISQLSGAADDKDADKIDSTTTQALNGTPVYYASNLHAGKEFYLNSLQENYQLSFSDDFADVMEQIETEYNAANQLTDVSDSEGGVTTSADTLLVRNWQDILAIYVYEKSLDGATSITLDSSCKDDLAKIFAEMNPIVRDKQNITHVTYGDRKINYYIKKNKIAKKDRAILKKYTETDCKLLCAVVTAANGYVRESVGDDVSEERVNVISAAYSLVGKVGYFWGGKSTTIGEDPSWGTTAQVSADGSKSLTTFGKSLSKIAKNGLSSFVTAFSDAKDQIINTGSQMITDFIIGVEAKHPDSNAEFRTVAQSAVDTIRTSHASFSLAGAYLVDGFVNGISANTYKAAAQAKAMASAAVVAAKKELDEHSPSKVFYGIGDFAGKGFINALADYTDKAEYAGQNVAKSAVNGSRNAIGKIVDVLNNGIDAEPTIRPVVDLSDVTKSVSDLNTLFSYEQAMSLGSQIEVTRKAKFQNGNANDIISAIDKLDASISRFRGDTYNLNGITYDDGSVVAEAIKTLVRATIVEGRI